MKDILKLAELFEYKVAQLQADTEQELAQHILSLYSSLGLTENTNVISFIDEEELKSKTLIVLIYQTRSQDPNWIKRSINYLETNLKRDRPDLTYDIRMIFIRALTRPNLPMTYKTLLEISRKPVTKEEVKQEVKKDLE